MTEHTPLERRSSQVKALVSAFCQLVEHEYGTDARLQRLKTVSLEGACTQPATLSVTQYWSRALEAAQHRPTAALAQSLSSLYPVLQWTQNPGYTIENAGPHFLANYGYAEIIGKDGMFPSDDLALGILLLGPGTIYAEHCHPASEIYYVVGGTAIWNVGGGPDIASRPGTLITIASGVIHKMWTTVDPLLAIYVWDGDVSARARFVD